jgi:predicted DNA binding CopG/RHH family protein
MVQMPKFKNESAEADWWASTAGRAFLKRQSKTFEAKGLKPTGSRLVAQLNEKKSAQLTVRLPLEDLRKARKIANRKGVACETVIRNLVHEALERQAAKASVTAKTKSLRQP